MVKVYRIIIFFILLSLPLVGRPIPFIFSNTNIEPFGSNAWVQKQVRILRSQANNIDVSVLRVSLIAYVNAKKTGITISKPLLTIIDYSKPAIEKRLWVFDLKNGKALFNTWVSHGRNSGGMKANSFSNHPGSLKSSIGVFVTDESYMGGKGYSLRLRGIEHGINDNAYRRDIVIHGAWYVGSDLIKKRGQIGRSWGCPAVSTDLVKPLINTIKEDTLLVAYYPDQRWLSHSRFLTA
ncbi:MAG TPA: murein L,D-transpeptidase catalytic domain family protein [Gammaproteobacteria bacterium]|nr:murein L,D-transpeptidase catalytic domain family protein [Gammaproteobacteria bacterium]